MTDELRLLTNCPRDCYDNCGIVAVPSADGRVQVRGDQDHPVNRGSLCAKCTIAYNGVWQDPEARLSTPLRRTGRKGDGHFEPLSWSEALELIADRVGAVVAERGAESVLHTHYSGTLSLLALLFPMRFFNRLGATEVEPDSICNMSGHVAWSLMFGTSIAGFDPRTADDASCLLIWGANPSHTAPHMDRNWVRTFDGAVVVVDPVRTETADRADLHLQPFPGTDAALAFAILHVLERNGAFDRGFIDANVHGVDELLPQLAACTPEWGERLTGVPAADVERAAELYAAGPALLWAGQGLQRQPSGVNIMRSVGLLPTLTGNVGKPGAGFYYLTIAPALLGADFDGVAGSSLAETATPKINHIGLADALLDPARFGALFVWNTNPAASAAEQNRLREALARDDLFTVVVDCFATDTADFADVVLPAAGFLEFDDLTFSYMNPIVGAQAKVREPIGQSLPNTEIFRLLAAAMNFEDPDLFEPDEVLIDRLLDQLPVDVTFEQLKQRGHVYLSDEPLDFHQRLRFRTPSGKIEVASDAAEADGLSRVPEPSVDPRPDSGRFRLLSPASKWRLNDSHANDSTIARRSGHPTVAINPEDATRLGIADDDRIVLANDAGELEVTAVVDDKVVPGVLLSYKGRWPKLEAGGRNVNALHEPRSSEIAGYSAVHGTEVRLVALEAPPTSA